MNKYEHKIKLNFFNHNKINFNLELKKRLCYI